MELRPIGIAGAGRRAIDRAFAYGVAFLFTLSTVFPAYANPTGGTVSGGAASITASGNTETITQSSSRAVIDWSTFNIGGNETTQFIQPSSSAIALNRVNSGTASNIQGALTANGDIIILNQNGVIFGAGSKVDVNGLIATTAGISNADFMNNTSGIFNFNIPGNPNAQIINNGTITAAQAGLVGLVAPNVINNGFIVAKMGKVQLGSGDTATIDMYGDNLMQVAVSDQVKSQLIANNGLIEADGGRVALTAAAGQAIVNSLITVPGEIKTPAVAQKNGEIVIYAAGSNAVDNNVAANKGTKTGSSEVDISGTLDASGTQSGQTGGAITVTGDHVALLTGASVNASGDAGGGTVQIGGDFHGAGTTPTALTTTIAEGVTINASAVTTGNGGNVAVWSDQETDFFGTILARGGAQSGNGGAVETSGANLKAMGLVNAGATNGKGGSWLLDPNNIDVEQSSCTGTSCASADSIGTSLSTGSDVTVTTTDGSITLGSTGGTTIADSGSTTQTLTFNAGTDIILNNAFTSAITASGSAKLNVVMDADTALGGGAIIIGGNITSNNGNITMGGQGSPATLAAIGDAGNINGISIDTATLNAGTGNISMIGKGYNGTNVNNGVYINASTVETSTGTIAITGTGNGSSLGNAGIYVNSDTIQSTSGTLNLTGTGSQSGGESDGVDLFGGTTVTSGGNISVTGTMGQSSSDAIDLEGTTWGGGTGRSTVQINTTGSGVVTLNGTGTVFVYIDSKITSASDINITATSLLVPNAFAYNSFETTGSGNINVNAGSVDVSTSNRSKFDFKTSGTGNIVIATNSLLEDNGSDGLNIGSAGNVTIKPLSSGTTVGVGTGTGTLSVTDDMLSAITAGTLTIGDATNTGAMDINTAHTFAAPTTFITSIASGNDMTLDSGITASAAGNALVLVSGNNFVNNSGSNSPLTAGSGRWLVYSTNASSDTSGASVMNPAQTIYNETYTSEAPGSVPNASENSWLYSTGLITITALGQTVTYGTTPNTSAALGTTYGFSCSNGCSSSVVTGGPTLSISGSNGTSTSGNYNVGSWTITPSTVTVSNGDSISCVAGTFTVSAKALTITANAQSVTYGSNIPTLAYATSGLVSGDSLTGALTTAEGGAGTASTHANSLDVGGSPYTITQGTLANSDYTITYNSANLTVAALGLTVSGFAVSNKTYNGNTTATISGNGSLSGVVGSDGVSLNSGGASATFDNANVGATHTVTASGYTLSGAQAGDYTLTQPTEHNVTINNANGTPTAVPTAVLPDTVAMVQQDPSAIFFGLCSHQGELAAPDCLAGPNSNHFIQLSDRVYLSPGLLQDAMPNFDDSVGASSQSSAAN